jgi:hypothetical protein
VTNSARSFIFNLLPDSPTLPEGYNHIPSRLGEVTFHETSISDDPEKPDAERTRNEKQRAKIYEFKKQNSDAEFRLLNGKSLDESAPEKEPENATDLKLAKMLGVSSKAIEPALIWAYRCYEVVHASRFSQVSPSGRRFQDYIYLFNVLIALECEPNQHDLRLFARAARNASNFLFDVTDGWMAFGQVVIGGPELMDCADIQIMASNRLLPRSWVGGFHEAKKYMPIRLGRGLWQKNNRVSIPWNEPEGYRVLIHEWAHYALELLDAYLETIVKSPRQAQPGCYRYLFQRSKLSLKRIFWLVGAVIAAYFRRYSRRFSPFSSHPENTGNSQQAQWADAQMVVPKICLPVESIMDSMEGTSELVPKQPGQRKQSEWDQIIAGMYEPRFPRIKRQPERIDGSLPLQDLPFIIRLVTKPTMPEPEKVSELLLFDVPPDINPEHCWVYILRYHNGTPSRIIAQGTLDARLDRGFRLLGAQQDDDIVLIGNTIGNSGRHEIVQRGHIQGVEAIEDPLRDKWQMGDKPYKAMVKWEPRDLKMVIPLVEIMPQPVESYDDPTTKIAVRVSGVPQDQVQITLFPLDQPQGIELEEGKATTDPVALDGHVLVSWGGPNQLIIVNYSQGGGPPTGSPVGATPMTAGSSEGNLMIFFADRGDYPQTHFSRIRIVTTRLPGMDATIKDAELDVDVEARSYAFSLSSNEPLPVEHLPTLVLAYDKRAELNDGEPFIYRKQEGQWVRITSYRPPNASYVAAPLNQHTAPNLFVPNPDTDNGRVEHYRLFFVPYSSASPSTGNNP